MYLFIVIGHTGQGKSTWVKEQVAGRNQYVFDINNEYNLPTDRGGIYPQMRHIDADVDKYVKIVASLKNTCIVFEDATGFLRGKQSAPFIRLIVSKRHTGNVYFIFFHSINRVPPELMEMSNYVKLFKTVDNVESLKKFNNQNLTDAFLRLQTAPKFSNEIIQMI